LKQKLSHFISIILLPFFNGGDSTIEFDSVDCDRSIEDAEDTVYIVYLLGDWIAGDGETLQVDTCF
jgi:hypothetical protein